MTTDTNDNTDSSDDGRTDTELELRVEATADDIDEQLAALDVDPETVIEALDGLECDVLAILEDVRGRWRTRSTVERIDDWYADEYSAVTPDADDRRTTISTDPDAYECSWCGGTPECVYDPDHPSERIVGKCDRDGIVYLNPVEDGGGER